MSKGVYYIPDDYENSSLDSSLNSSTYSDFKSKNGPQNNQPGQSALSKNIIVGNPQVNSNPGYGDISAFAKYTLNWINKREGEKLLQFVIELPINTTVIDAIRDIIPLVNKKLEEENSNYRLHEAVEHFELFKSKKTGHPKTDYPALDSLQILNQTGIHQISLVENSKAIYSTSSPLKKGSSVLKSGSLMAEPTVPKSGVPTGTSSYETEYTETICFCIPIKKKVSSTGLNERLLN